MSDAAVLAEVLSVYRGSDGDKTRALYGRLETLGPDGALAVNLFRAQKASERAKVYRGGVAGRGSYSGMAYDRKQWATDNLCAALAGAGLGWGWGVDSKQPVHRHVLYVDLPTGQISFHAAARGIGPDYPGEWDGVPGQSADRILRWCARLLAQAPACGALSAP
jgi:hypothetical protein